MNFLLESENPSSPSQSPPLQKNLSLDKITFDEEGVVNEAPEKSPPSKSLPAPPESENSPSSPPSSPSSLLPSFSFPSPPSPSSARNLLSSFLPSSSPRSPRSPSSSAPTVASPSLSPSSSCSPPSSPPPTLLLPPSEK
uniref:Uncharacterized protein n=1 Tax=Paramoeba aestuarina TaxID=180227 RepID=A0A7S4P908_9EUKA|mmetsp:Transcript_3824/g.5882  ORF Transcript_3824/g.5882 Transcript_3824/m.5882 type:complete len:139 (+) Transcript_3824:387-803(+)